MLNQTCLRHLLFSLLALMVYLASAELPVPLLGEVDKVKTQVSTLSSFSTSSSIVDYMPCALLSP